MDHQPGDDDELTSAFEVLLIAQNEEKSNEDFSTFLAQNEEKSKEDFSTLLAQKEEKSKEDFSTLLAQNEEKSNEDFSILLPDVVPDWAADEEPNHQLDCGRLLAENLEQTSSNVEKTTSGRHIRRASRRSSIIRLPAASGDSSIEHHRAGPSQIENEHDEHTGPSCEDKDEHEHTGPSSEDKSKNATPCSNIDVEQPSEKVESKLKKPETGKFSSVPAHRPLAEQMQRYFNEVPSRFHSFPTKRANSQPTVAAKRKSMAVQNPMPGRSSAELKVKELNKPDCGPKAFPPPNLAKVSTKFTSSSAKPDLHKFTARPAPRPSVAYLPRAASLTSVVLEESNGKTRKKLVNTHVGVPQSECSGGRKLVVKPFSFVERHERARKLREEKLKQALEESLRFPKFKANPLPSYLTEKTNTEASSSKQLPKTEQLDNKSEKENLPLH